MKIKVIEDPEIESDLIITCKSLTPKIQHFIDLLQTQKVTAEYRGTEIHVDLDKVLFFETDDVGVVLHQTRDFYLTRYKLYELLEMLPQSFVRISKSCIVNVDLISGYDRNLTSARIVRFYNSEKTNYVSRMYFNDFKTKLNERSL